MAADGWKISRREQEGRKVETLADRPVQKREFLPAIDIAVRSDGRCFVTSMAEIGRKAGNYDVEEHLDVMGNTGLDIVNFRDRRSSPHVGLGGQLIADATSHKRVSVEIRAEFWDPNPPTGQAYSIAARSIFGPLISAYNQAHGTRYRLRIQRPLQEGPNISPHSAQLLKRFTCTANPRAPHPNDWKRFYEFVRLSRKELSAGALRSLLLHAGFPSTMANHISETYHHLWAFKQLR